MNTSAPAPIYKRLFALIYDGLLTTAILFVATFIALYVRGGESFGPNHIGFLIYLGLCSGFYIVWCWRHGGQTLGMMAWKLKLESSANQPLSMKQAIIRFILGVIGLWSLGIGFIWCFIDKDKQSLADRLSQTQIVNLK